MNVETETLYQEIHQIICSEFGKIFDFELHMEIQGRFREEGIQYVITKLDLPISVDEYISRALLLYKEIFPKSKLKPGIKQSTRDKLKIYSNTF